MALHTRHLRCVWEGIGQCLLLQTLSLATCNSTLGGLTIGHGILRSGPKCANIFLMRVKKNLYVKFCSPYMRNEECSYWEWPGLTGERTIFSSTWMCDGWWLNCWPFCHPYPHNRCDGYNPSQFSALWLFLLHYRNYLPLRHCQY